VLRSEPRLTPEVQDDLDRLDAALLADRHGAGTGSVPLDADLRADAAGVDPHADRAGGAGGPATPPDDLDRELLALVADVRATRPELDAGTRMRLEVRVQDAKAASRPRRAPRLTTDRRWRAGLALAAVVAVAIPVGVAMTSGEGGLSGDLGGDDATSLAMGESATTAAPGSSQDDAAGAGSAAAPSSPETTEAPSATSGSSSGELERQSIPESTQDTTDSMTVPPSPSPSTTAVPPTTRQAPLDATRRVIRDVEQTVRIEPGQVARAADRVTGIVQGAGGYLGASEVRERGPRAGGTFQVVVPTSRLDETVAALSRIGRPVRLERSSTDVTDQAVSLDDQLGDLRADRSAARLALARTVGEARRAARRRELNLLSSRIAALQGQRDALRRQTSTSRIDLRLTTTKAAEDEAPPAVDDGSWGIGDAWSDAGRVLEVGGGVLLVGGVIVVPLAALLALGLGLRRRAAGRRRDGVIDGA